MGGNAPGEQATGMREMVVQKKSPPKGTSGKEVEGGVSLGAQEHRTARASGRGYPKAWTHQPVFTKTFTTFVELHLDTKEEAQLMKALVEQVRGFF